MNTPRPRIEVAVTMQRIPNTGPASRWQPWRWELADVSLQEPGFGRGARLLLKTERAERWLHAGLAVELFVDDAEGYYLNISTDVPCWFVLWRMEEVPTLGPEPMPVPTVVSLSYYDAGRWLDAQETVEQVPAPPEVVLWLRQFVDAHYVIEPKRRRRPESFKSLTDRFGNPASISTYQPRAGKSDAGGACG